MERGIPGSAGSRKTGSRNRTYHAEKRGQPRHVAALKVVHFPLEHSEGVLPVAVIAEVLGFFPGGVALFFGLTEFLLGFVEFFLEELVLLQDILGVVGPRGGGGGGGGGSKAEERHGSLGVCLIRARGWLGVVWRVRARARAKAKAKVRVSRVL